MEDVDLESSSQNKDICTGTQGDGGEQSPESDPSDPNGTSVNHNLPVTENRNTEEDNVGMETVAILDEDARARRAHLVNALNEYLGGDWVRIHWPEAHWPEFSNSVWGRVE